MSGLLITAIALIVYGSLYPWHFTAPQSSVWLTMIRSWPAKWDLFAMKDASINLIVYAPAGALGFLSLARRHSSRVAAATTIFAGLSLSLSMEVAQAFIPGRTSSFADVVFNTAGAAIGAWFAWRIRRRGSHSWQHHAAPVLMLVCWACHHEYPLVPSVAFARMRFELAMWLHPQSVSPVDIWSYAAEWIAAAVAVETLFGRKALRWLPAAVSIHFFLRPFIPARPLVFEEILGMLVAFLLWKTVPEPVKRGPWLLISVILLRECSAMHWYGTPPFSWIPFQPLIASDRTGAVGFISRAMFDYTAVLWLWRSRGMPYRKSGAILVSLLAVLAAIQRYLPGDVLSMTDPVLALVAALICYSAESGAAIAETRGRAVAAH